MATTNWVIVYEGAAADTGQVRDLLEAAGIPARLGDEYMGTIAPYVIAGGTTAAVKVLAAEDHLEAARAVVEAFTARATPARTARYQPWECPCCHEPNDGTFDICWNCQTEKVR